MAPCFPQNKSQILPLAYEARKDLLAPSRPPFPGAPVSTSSPPLCSSTPAPPSAPSPGTLFPESPVPDSLTGSAPVRAAPAQRRQPAVLSQRSPSPVPCTPRDHACSLLHFLWAMCLPDRTQGSLGRGFYLFSSLTAPKHLEWAWHLVGGL